MKRIYLADDEKNIRELIATFLKNEGFDVIPFENGDLLMEAFAKDPADLLILDITMPGTDGLTLCTRIREQSNVPMILVSARDSELDRITGITLGSDDYLTKPFSPMELIVRVKALFRRSESTASKQNGEVLSFGDLEINSSCRNAKIKENPFDMTPTEFALMGYMLENRERAVSREELLRNIWKFDVEVDTRACDDVIKRLRKKLSAADSSVRIVPVWGFGFKLEVANEDN